jgi:hypothetical protein
VRYGFDRTDRFGDDRNAPRTNPLTHRIRMRLRFDERIRPTELTQPVHVGVRDERLAVPPGPADPAPVEIDPLHEEGVHLDRVEQIRVLVQHAAETGARREERMRSDDEAVGPRLQPPHVVEAGHLPGRVGEIEQEDVFSANGALDAPNEDNAALAGVRREIAEIELTIVKRDGERRKPQRRGPIDQRAGVVGN